MQTTLNHFPFLKVMPMVNEKVKEEIEKIKIANKIAFIQCKESEDYLALRKAILDIYWENTEKVKKIAEGK